MVLFMEAKTVQQCKDAEELLRLSERTSALLDDSEGFDYTNDYQFRLTRKLTPSEFPLFIKLGKTCDNGLLTIDDMSLIDIGLLFKLGLRPVNSLAKQFYHKPLESIIENSHLLYLSNSDKTAIMRLEYHGAKWHAVLFNSMEDSKKSLTFRNSTEIFEEFLYSFFVYLSKTEFDQAKHEINQIGIERQRRPTILEQRTILPKVI